LADYKVLKRVQHIVMDLSITADPAEFEQGEPATLLKIVASEFEVNVWLRADEVASIRRVASTASSEGTLKIGQSANAPVYWSVDGDALMLLIGSDDVTWDIAVSLPASALPVIISEIERSVARE
jgi:hypothetical protein